MIFKGVIFLFSLILFSWGYSYAQFQYQYSQDIPVQEGEKLLSKPWTGGLDLAQYNSVNLNDDEHIDLMVFDRNLNRVITFISTGTEFLYSPEYQQYFPSGLKNWVVMRDFNCDGKADIFTSSLFGMSLYENTSSGSSLSWELVYSTIFTEGSSGQVNLQVNNGDYPAIEDVDNDGDLDILVFDFAVGGGVNLHKNMSVERTSECGIDLVLTTDRYGEFEECTCDVYIFGTEVCPESGRLEHVGGKAVVSYAYSNTDIQDLLIGQEDCTLYGYLENSGSLGAPQMTNVNFNFPNVENPIALNYPLAFNLDLDFDGKDDLLATNNMFYPEGNQNYSANNWFYKGDGSGYNLITKGYMQEEMIDIGFGASPAFSDIDGDGDQDLIIGNGNLMNKASLAFYQNNGDVLNPSMMMVSDDYLSLAGKGYESIRTQFLDLNGNGYEDLIIMSSQDNLQAGQIYWHTTNPLQPFIETETAILKIPFSTNNDNPFFYLSNGKLVELIGREAGNLTRYINQGSLDNPQWELSSDEFLGITENFMARNLTISISDLDKDGKNDLVSYDDSKILSVYSDFSGDAIRFENLLYDENTLLSYNPTFGARGKVTTTYLTGAELPTICIGLASGGIQLLANTLDDQQNVEIPIRVAVFPNPLSKQELLQVIANKDVTVHLLDTQGHRLSPGISLLKGEQLQLEVGVLRSGMYLMEAIDVSGNRTTSKFVLLN